MKCRICNSTEHLMARCPNNPNRGDGNGGASSSSFAALTDAPPSSPYMLNNASKKVRFPDDLPVQPPSFPTGSTSAPAPPWEGEDQADFDPPPGFLVLPGNVPEGDEAHTHHVFMHFSGQDRLQDEDPWRTWMSGRQDPPAPPFNPTPTITQRVVGAVAAVSDAIRGRSQSPAPLINHPGAAPHDAEAPPGHPCEQNPWFRHLPGPAAPHPYAVAQQLGPPQAYLPDSSQPPPYKPGWSTPPVRPVREMHASCVLPGQSAAASGTTVGEASRAQVGGTTVGEPACAQASSRGLTPTQQQMQNIVDCQNWAQAERKKDPKYKERKDFPRITQHSYPPDQFMTSRTAAPLEPKTVPTNVYPSS